MTRKEAELYRAHINSVIEPLENESALAVTDLFEPWHSYAVYVDGDRVKYFDNLYCCVQGHTSQDDWTPDITPALWTRVNVEEYPEWVQPTGAQDAYMTGDKVTYKERRWICDYDNNIYAPDVWGWHEIE